MLFTVLYLGLEPRIALERADSGELRLTKIVELIKVSKYSIHDLSRSEAAKAGEPYRLNMPFELGVDYGCRLFGKPQQREKLTLILEGRPHASKAAISDLSGVDIQCHHGDPYQVFRVVRNWLNVKSRLFLNAFNEQLRLLRLPRLERLDRRLVAQCTLRNELVVG